MTPYNKIFKRFELKIEDSILFQVSKEDRNEWECEILDSALGVIELKGLKMKSDLTSRDDELQEFSDTLTSGEIETIALFMVAVWYDPKVNSLEHTSLFMGSKDEKWSNQKDHWKATAERQESYYRKAIKYFRDYKYKNNDYKTGE